MPRSSRSARTTGTDGSARRRLPALAALAAATALAAGVTAPAYAAEPASVAPVVEGRPGFHPDQDFAGSTVAAHEGRGTAAPFASLAATQTPGLDVSGYQGNVNWSSVSANGAKFAYVKATEGTGYTNPYFAQISRK
ncbi:GH25 family lysozyme [Streptomyces sp. LS1784]|uniref:GH25 family lysozyme n=1 Tax=Streptomyces sp. LS1784 TaxID=2851533 RepID=UPI0021E1339D|nr:GH25 family lysozyme [Streptomyces sp. LS1784]